MLQDQESLAAKPLPDDGKRGYRLEIDEFMADNAMVNVFLLALSGLQQNSLKKVDGHPNWLNYYALGAMHGRPTEAWNGFPNGEGGRYGYCHHDSDTFPTWHRPYMMLYETMIQREMINQANKFQDPIDKNKYLDAAARFRLPYWDPLMPRNKQVGTDMTTVWGLPELFKRDQIYLRTPESPKKLVLMPNPMYQFVFPTDTEWKESQRQPRLVEDKRFNQVKTTRTPGANGESDIGFLNLSIQRQGLTIANKLWKMMSPDEYGTNSKTGARVMINHLRPWSYFANHNAERGRVKKFEVDGQQYETVSLESWHDAIHVLIGQGRFGQQGQMGDPTVAGFEPMFWMHHNNVDRILSLYQALYAKNVDDPTQLLAGLVPFMKNGKRELWTSNDSWVKDYWLPGYASPGNKSADPKQIQDVVKRYLTDTYYWATTRGITEKVALPTGWPQDLSRSEALLGEKAIPTTKPRLLVKAVGLVRGKPQLVARIVPLAPASGIVSEDQPIQTQQILNNVVGILRSLPGKVLEAPVNKPKQIIQIWDVHIRVRKFAFNGPFSVHVFLGWVKDDQTERFMTKKNEVGFAGIFSRSFEGATDCQNCQESREKDLVVSDVIPLTTYLTDYLDSNPSSAGLIAEGEHKTIHSLNIEHVIPFLREQLQWRMIDLSSNLLSGQEQAAGLVVAVTNRTYTPPDNDNLMGVYGPETMYVVATNGKPGGLGFTYPNGTIVTWE